MATRREQIGELLHRADCEPVPGPPDPPITSVHFPSGERDRYLRMADAVIREIGLEETVQHTRLVERSREVAGRAVSEIGHELVAGLESASLAVSYQAGFEDGQKDYRDRVLKFMRKEAEDHKPLNDGTVIYHAPEHVFYADIADAVETGMYPNLKIKKGGS